MGRQWLREWEVSAGGVTLSGDLRIVFVVQSSIDKNPPPAEIKLYNLAPHSANSIFSAAKTGTVTLSAGYQDNSSMIFSGKMIKVNLGKDNSTDTTTTIYAKAGDEAHNTAVINKTLKAGATGLDKFKELIKVMPGVQAGRIPTDQLQAIKYPRSVTMFGPARHFMQILATTVDASWYFDAVQPLLHMSQFSDTGNGSPIVINSDTGMIGLPTQTSDGINVRCLLNPQIKVHSVIKIDEKSIQKIAPDLTITGTAKNENPLFQAGIDADGLYKVVYLEQVGDSRGDVWFCECNCRPNSGGGTQSQIRSNRS